MSGLRATRHCWRDYWNMKLRPKYGDLRMSGTGCAPHSISRIIAYVSLLIEL